MKKMDQSETPATDRGGKTALQVMAEQDNLTLLKERANQHARMLNEKCPPADPGTVVDTFLGGKPFPHGMGGEMAAYAFHKSGEDITASCPHVVTGPVVRYVCGFLFDSRFDHVALVKKAKPDWQVGLLNGIGGKVELNDITENAAMARDFEEETQCIYLPTWEHFLTLNTPGIEVAFFAAHADKRWALHGLEDEPVGWYQVDPTFRPSCIPNLSWLIPMAKLKLQRPDWKEQSTLTTT
jgi:8-oxo-dGTP diphosphatase